MCISAWRRYTCEKMGYAYERLYEYENKYTGLMLAAKNCYEALIGENASIAGMFRHFILTKTSGRVKGIKIEACQLDTAFIGSAEIASTMNKIIVQCYKKNIRLGSVFERNNGEKSIVLDRFISVPKHGGQWLFKLKAASSKRPAFAYWVNQQMFTLAEDAEYIEPVGCEKVNLLGGIGKPFVAVKYNGKCEIVNTNDVALPSPLDIGVRVFNTGGLENGIFGKDYREEAITFNTARDFIIYLRAYPEKVRDTCDQFYTAVYNAAYCLYTGKGFADYNGVRYYYFRYLLFTRLSIDMACKLGKNTGCINTKYKMGNTITFGDGPEGYMVDIEFVVGAGRTYEKMSEDRAMVFNKHKLKEDDQSIFPLYNKEYEYAGIHKNNDLIFWDGKNLTDVMLDVCNKKIPYMTVDRFDTLLSRRDTVELIDKTGFITDLTSKYDIENMFKGEGVMHVKFGHFSIMYEPYRINVRNLMF